MSTKADTEKMLTVRRAPEARSRQDVGVTTVPVSHCEGSDVIGMPTAPWEEMAAFATGEPAVLSSNDSAESATGAAVLERPSVAGCRLAVGASGERRSPEHSRMVVLVAGDTDHVLERNAGVAPAPAGPDHLWGLIRAICRELVAVGVPDPFIARVGRPHAGTLQLAVGGRLVGISGSAMWSEGALRPAGRRFGEHFRFHVDQGSVAEGVKLVKTAQFGGILGASEPGAVAPKMPPGVLLGFCLTTRRTYFSRSEALVEGGGVAETRALPAEAGGGSHGCTLDGRYRRNAGGRARQWARSAHVEPWAPSSPTKRGSTE